MAKKKQGGKTTQHKRPQAKMLGVKVGNGQTVAAGMILIRQRGTKFGAGNGVKVGRDHTLFAAREGKVKFGNRIGKKQISIV